MSIKILIADNQPFFRCGIRSELARCQEFEVVGEASNPDEMIQFALECHPAVVLLELNMICTNIHKIISQCTNGQAQGVNILALTSNRSADTIEESLKDGAKGYVLKEEKPKILIEAIQMVDQGRTWLSPAAAEIIAKKMAQKTDRSTRSLSDRELEILKRLGQGSSNTQVARELCIAERTVRYHLEKAFDKLGVNNRVEAVARVTQNGWISV